MPDHVAITKVDRFLSALPLKEAAPNIWFPTFALNRFQVSPARARDNLKRMPDSKSGQVFVRTHVLTNADFLDI